MKPIIVSYATEHFLPGLKTLQESIEENWKGESKLFTELPKPKLFQAKSHQDCPYQFKLAVIQYIREQGYTQIFWLDTSMRVLKDLTELLDENGVMAFDNLGHPLYKYISDKATHNLTVSEEKLKTIPQVWGGAIGFDFENKVAQRVFGELIYHSSIGSFDNGGSVREGFVAHRHDQAVMSVVFHNNHIKLQPYGRIITGEHDKEPYIYGKDIYIKYGK